MNCRELEADVVDLARGAAMSAAAAARAGAHVEQCADCSARFARERQLTIALKAMADRVPPSPRSAVIEEQLLAAFAARKTASPQTQARRRGAAAPAAWMWLAAAAVLVAAVAVWPGSPPWRSTEEVRPDSAQVSASPAAAQPLGLSEPEPARAPVTATPAVAPGPAAPPRASGRLAPARREPPPATDKVLRFVSLPTALGLPALESGRIVRVEVPTAMLPAYGLQIPPDSAAGLVEADVLVGQDGQPRAIRFVTLDSEPRRRQ